MPFFFEKKFNVRTRTDHHTGTLCEACKVEMAERSKAAASGAVPLRRARVRTSLSIKREAWSFYLSSHRYPYIVFVFSARFNDS